MAKNRKKIAQNVNVNKLEHLREVDIPRRLTILVPTPNKNKINSLSVSHHNQNTLHQPVMYIPLLIRHFMVHLLVILSHGNTLSDN